MKLFSTLFVLIVLALPAFGQSSNRRSDSLTNLLATINPTVVATGSKVTYDVYGYYAFGDWGGAREFTLTTNIGALTTNLAHVIRSPVNTNWYWVSADQNNDDQDPRWWGADGTGAVDSTTNIQAAVNYSPVHHRRLYLPPGQTFKISQPILFETGLSGSDDYMAINVDGNNSTLISYAPVNIFALKAQSIFYGKIQDVVFTYDQTYTNSTAHNVISLRGDPTGPNYYNIYNVSFHNLTFLRGYYAIKQEEWCSPWGNDYRRWFVSQEMVGGAVDFSPTSNFGNVNNVFESIYVRADMMAGPVFKIKNQNSFAMKDIELNVLHDKQAMLLTASSSVNIQNWRMEVGSFNNAYDGLFQFANVTQLIWDNLQIQSFDLDAPAGTWNYIIRDVGSGPAVNTSSLQFNNLYLLNTTKTNAASYLAFIYSPYQRYTLQTWDSDLSLVNAYAAYPFGAPATNVTAQPWHRNITDLPTLPGEISFDANNWPYISTGIGSTTNWLRLGNADVFGPASSTDNAVARFDGTTGKLIQNSLVTIDDLGNIVSPGQTFAFGPGYGNPIIVLDGQKGEGGPASGVRAIDIKSAGSLRWRVGGNSTTETNINNTGSEFELQAYSNAGGYLRTVWRAMRDTGLFQTFGDISVGGVGAADASTIGYNTGSPEGLYAAYPGSLRLDKNGNLWIKDSGAGTTTGWIQIPETPSVYAGGTLSTNIKAGTGISISVAGSEATISATASSYTNFWYDLTNALVAGANVTLTPNSPSSGKLTIASSGSGGGTNLWQIGVDGALVSSPNLADSTGIAVAASGTNVTYALVDRDFGDITTSSSGTVMTIDSGSVTTNKIDTTFYDWVNSKGGSVYADGTTTTNLKSSPSIRLTTTGSETTLALSNTTVTAGSYTLASITVDAQGRITSAANGSASTNSGSVVSWNGVQQGTLNITNSAEITAGLSGTNGSFSIAASSLATNKINTTFYDWINGKGGTTVNNTWTGTNTFTDLFADELYINTLIVTNPIPVSSGGTGTNTFPLYAILYGNTTNPIGNVASVADRIVGWNGSGVPVAYSAGSGITISGGQISASGGGGSGSTFVSGTPITNANFVSSANATVSVSSATNVTYTFTGVGSATNGYLYKSVTVLTNLDNSGEAFVFDVNLPGDVLSENGDEIEIFTAGKFLNDSGSDGGYTWRLYLDGEVSPSLSGNLNSSFSDLSSSRSLSFSVRIRRMSETNIFLTVLHIAGDHQASYSTNEIVQQRYLDNKTISDLSGIVNLSFSLENSASHSSLGQTLYGLTILKLGSAGGNSVSGGDVYTTSNNVFTGSNTFSGAVMLGTTNLASAIALKAPLADPALTGTPTVNGTNLMAEIFLKAPKASPVLTNPQLTNGLTFGQSSLSAHSAGTNFVVDPTINQYHLITVSNTNAVRFLHLTNAAPGRQTVVLVNVTTNTTVTVALGANQFASTTNLVSLTQGQILPLSFYCYGENNTNVIVTMPTTAFVYR